MDTTEIDAGRYLYSWTNGRWVSICDDAVAGPISREIRGGSACYSPTLSFRLGGLLAIIKLHLTTTPEAAAAALSAVSFAVHRVDECDWIVSSTGHALARDWRGDLVEVVPHDGGGWSWGRFSRPVTVQVAGKRPVVIDQSGRADTLDAAMAGAMAARKAALDALFAITDELEIDLGRSGR